LAKLQLLFDKAAPAFQEGTLGDFRQYFSRLDEGERIRLLERFKRADFQAETAGRAISFYAGWPGSVDWRLQELAPHLLPGFDLKKRLRPATEPVNFLSGLWQHAASILPEASCDELVGFATALLRAEGIDYKHMEQYLKARRAEFLANPKAFHIAPKRKSEDKKS
jgi:hypothetical protein